MKKALFAVLALALMACGVAHAADPNLVKGINSNGFAVVFDLSNAQVIKKDASNSRVSVRSPLGEQFMQDDAGWNQYNKLVAACGSKCVAVPGASDGKVVSVRNMYAQCPTGYSQVVYPNWTESLTGDGCAFFNQVQSIAN